MLKINYLARIRLRATGAIQLDIGGEEVLTGLTMAESNFMLSISGQDPQQLDPGDMLLIGQLKHRHLEARLERFYLQQSEVRRN